MTASLLNAYITEIERPAPARPGPLHGVRFATKDLIATAGIRTTAGSLILKDWIPKRSAPIVRALEAAGAVNVGKTNTHEFAFGTTNDNPHYGATRNPWNPGLTTGGSSGGSAAAVAAGIVRLALGTDTAGSVRIPAALCGCVGFKPGFGTISTRGVIPLAPTLDTVGFLTADVAEAARAYAVATRRSAESVHGWTDGPTDRRTADPHGLTIGVFEDHAFGKSEGAVVRAVEEALRKLESLGAKIKRVALPVLERVVEIGVPLVRTEALRYHQRWFPARRAEYGADVAMSLEAATQLTARDYAQARLARRRLEREVRRMLGEVDLLAGPTVPILAFPNRVAWEPVLPGGELPRFALTRLTYPFSLARLPAISVPCGLSESKLPVGLQLGADRQREDLLLDVALAYERARGPLPLPPVSAPA